MSANNPYKPIHNVSKLEMDGDKTTYRSRTLLVAHFIAFAATFFGVRIATNFYFPFEVATVTCAMFWLPHACISLLIDRARRWPLANGIVGALTTWLGIGAVSWITTDRIPQPQWHPIPFTLVVASISLFSVTIVAIVDYLGRKERHD